METFFFSCLLIHFLACQNWNHTTRVFLDTQPSSFVVRRLFSNTHYQKPEGSLEDVTIGSSCIKETQVLLQTTGSFRGEGGGVARLLHSGIRDLCSASRTREQFINGRQRSSRCFTPKSFIFPTDCMYQCHRLPNEPANIVSLTFQMIYSFNLSGRLEPNSWAREWNHVII